MALFSGLPCQCIKHVLKRSPFSIINALPALQKSTSVDAIDSFTTDLLEEKMLKWQIFRSTTLDKCAANRNTLKDNFVIATKSVVTDYEDLKKSDLWLDVRKLSEDQMSSLLATSLDIGNDEDFVYLINQCVRWKVLLPKSVLERCLDHLSLLARLKVIEDLKELYKVDDAITFADYDGFETFKAMALWRNGSSDSALTSLVDCTRRTSTSGRKLLHAAFKLISKETLKSKSEAVLVQLVKTAEIIYEESRDIFAIGCVWKNCFESDWFSDQQIAGKMFEDLEELRSIVYKRATTLCCDFLKENNAEAVHRLMELCLKYENKNASKACLNALFEYNYWRRDLRACAEIIKNSLELNIPLSATKSEKLINLLLNQPLALISKPNVQKFTYKF